MATPNTPLWEVFIRSRNGLAHKHVGSLHATDATLALQAARERHHDFVTLALMEAFFLADADHRAGIRTI